MGLLVAHPISWIFFILHVAVILFVLWALFLKLGMEGVLLTLFVHLLFTWLLYIIMEGSNLFYYLLPFILMAEQFIQFFIFNSHNPQHQTDIADNS